MATQAPPTSGFLRIKGIVFMFINTFFIANNYILQKVILQRSEERKNPINAYETMYWICLMLLPMCLASLKFINESLFPIPKEVRAAFLMRCFFGMLANVIYIFSLQYISFSEATVIYWTSPVFTSIGARYVLKENLSNFDWVAVLTAFIGIVLMQNPFQQS